MKMGKYRISKFLQASVGEKNKVLSKLLKGRRMVVTVA
jgi:hypothetical protein